MKKITNFTLFLLLSCSASSAFAYTDSDMDGVADNMDKCPNTPFSDLVDINGCSKVSLNTSSTSNQHFDIILGGEYSDSDHKALKKSETYASTLQVDYYYKQFSIQASTSYYDTEADGYSDSGMNDSFIGAAYQFQVSKALSLRVGLGALLPTYDTDLNNNNTDYTGSLNLSYTYKKINLFAGYSHTLINDDDVQTQNIKYQDTNAYSAGVGYYFTNKLYMNAAYNSNDSVYDGAEDIQTASAYAYYSFTKNWFATASYAYGISDNASENYASLKIGYYY